MILVAVLALGVLALTWFGFRSLRRKRLIENVPTSKVKGVFLGLNEVKGEVECDRPLRAHLSSRHCVYYRYEIQEHWSRTETYRDSKGKTQTRTSSGWRTVEDDTVGTAFTLRDDTGGLRVDPAGAEIHAPEVFSETCGRSDPLYYGKGPSHSVSDSTHRRRFTETALPLGDRVYVLGSARLRDDVVEPEITHDRSAEIYLISTRPESRIASGYGWGAFFQLFFAALFVFAGSVLLTAPGSRDLGQAIERGLPLALPLLALFGGMVVIYYLVLVYNGLVSVRERAEMALSMIDIQLRRRHDLVPRLVACVQGHANYERLTQERVAGLRGGDDTGSLKSLFALVEDYPELKADENFAHLQAQLVDCEDRVSLAREFYNETVTALRNRLQTLPDSLLKGFGRFKKLDYLSAAKYERTAPRLDL